MVFKFFKEMIGALKEGVDEAKAELAQEQQAEEQQAREVAARLDSLPIEEQFATALGAPYRRLFVGSSRYDLCAMDVPEAKKSELAGYLKRDFDVNDRNSLRNTVIQTRVLAYCLAAPELSNEAIMQEVETLLSKQDEIIQIIPAQEIQSLAIVERIAHLLARETPGQSLAWSEVETLISPYLHQTLPDESRNRMATWLSRQSYMLSASVGVGYLHKEEALQLFEPFKQLALKHIKSWQDFADLFIAGEKQDGTNNALGRKVLSSQVSALLKDADSPWNTIAWPNKATTLG